MRDLKGVGPGKGFILRFGKDLVKSDKQTLVCGWGGELFVFELSRDQSEGSPFNPKTMTLSTVAEGARSQPELTLSPQIDGAEATRRILAADAAARVVVLTSFADDRHIVEALQAESALLERTTVGTNK